jgi:hypothetical protein
MGNLTSRRTPVNLQHLQLCYSYPGKTGYAVAYVGAVLVTNVNTSMYGSVNLIRLLGQYLMMSIVTTKEDALG